MSVLFLGKEQMKKRVLLLEWASFGTPFVIDSFHELGYQVDKFPIPRERIDTRSDVGYAEQLVHQMMGKEYACIFTFNYFPMVAIAYPCNSSDV